MIMLKIFTTQLLGILQKVAKQEADNLEDASRILAQTILSNGTVYFYGKGALHSTVLEAISGYNQFPNAKILDGSTKSEDIQSLDSIILFTDDPTDDHTLNNLDSLKQKGIQIIGVYPFESNDSSSSILDQVDVHIDLKGNDPLVPLNNETRIGQPLTLTALYTYLALYLNTMEIIDEF